jgi:DNA-binding transcriptional regulator YhcF (GntR family)
MMKSEYFYLTVLIASLLIVVFVNLDLAYTAGPKQERSAPRFMQQLNDEQKAEMESMIADMKAAGATREEIHTAVKEKLEDFGIKPPEKEERKDGRGFRGPRHDGPMFDGQLSEEQRTAIRDKVDQLKDQGASREEIHEAVTEMLKSYGVEPPEGGFEGPLRGHRHGGFFPGLELTEEQQTAIREKVEALNDQSASREEIHEAVAELLKSYGIKPLEQMREHRELMRQLTPEQQREVHETVRKMRQDGASREEIREAVNSLFKQYGLQIPGNDQQQETEESSGGNNLQIENFPNPFNPETTIQYVTPAEGQVTIQIYDIQGKLIRSLLHEFQSAGTHTLRWDGLNETGTRVPSGTYFLRVTAGTEKVSKRIIMTK